jgi:signal transduction histidine kinase/CheY-like chemotaxis protein/HPt (histidine-containing phosphotransfer) domain-containing protein
MMRRASVRTQFWLLGLVAVAGLLLVLGAENALLRGARDQFDRQEEQNSVRRAREALTRSIESDRRRITETAWWDEAYAYMGRPAGPGARRFLQENFVDWLPEQYGDEYIGIWRADRTRRFRWVANGSAGLDTLLPTEALFNRLDDRRSAAGIVPIGGQLYFLTGALILPSSGGDQRTASRGYLVTARRVSQDRLRDLAQSLQEDVHLRPAAADARDNTTRREIAAGDTVSTAFLVPNFFGRRSIELELRASRSFLAGMERWIQRSMLIVLALSFGLLGLATLLVARLVVWPFRWLGGEFRRMRKDGRLTRLPPGPAPARDWTLLIDQFNKLAEAREASERALALARDEALAATRAKSEFLANMSHEIRTPMNAIIGFSDLLRQSPLAPEQREYAELVQNSAEALLSLINEILDLSKVEAGRLVLEEIPFNLHRVMGETMMLFATRARERGLVLNTTIAPEVPRCVLGDPGRLRQVLINLLSNSLKFTQTGEIRLGVETVAGEPGLLRFRVTDTGIGIPPEKLGAIFEKFTQADTSTTRRFGGTGLGLTICRELVRLMQGVVSVESEPGRGSTFSFTARLPLTEATETTAEVVAHEAAPVAGRRVLIVDDNELNRLVGREYLRRLGCEVETVSGGREAVDRVARGGIELVFMDCQMPEMDGYEATGQIRLLGGELGRVRIVAMTANAMQGDRERCLDAGMDDYVSKPIREAELAAVLRRVDGPQVAAGAPASGSVDLPVLDEALLQSLTGTTPEGVGLVGRLVDIFRRDAAAQAKEMGRLVLAGMWPQVARQAHTLRGAASTLGAMRVADLCGRLERTAADGAGARVTPESAQLGEEVVQALAALNRWQEAVSTGPREPHAARATQGSGRA